MKIREVRHLLTYDCNLRCKHCYLSAGEFSEAQMNFTSDTVDKFYSFFKPEIVSATGGEPLLFPDKTIMIARSTALYGGQIEIVTNGILLSEKLANMILEANPNTFFQISLDGLERYHNYLRNDTRAFKLALRAIKIASTLGVLVKVRLTATDQNFEQITGVINVLDSLESPNIRLVIRPVLSAGRALKNDLKITHDLSEFDKFNYLSNAIKVETTDNSGKCGCGVDTITIDPFGDIYPCTYFVNMKEYRMGNIYQGFETLSENEEFKQFKGGCYARDLRKVSI